MKNNSRRLLRSRPESMALAYGSGISMSSRVRTAGVTTS
jgi:hypothetical protein